jgi:hypothetical protein
MRTSVLLCPAFALALSTPSLLPAQASFLPPQASNPITAVVAVAVALPDAPVPAAAIAAAAIAVPPCRTGGTQNGNSPEADSADQSREPCLEGNPYTRFLNTTAPAPLTPEQKGRLALHNLKDPGNLVTIVGTAAFTIGADSHTAYGPGWKGFGKNAGVSLLQDSTGEFFGTFLIPSLTREDPHYHRMPNASFGRRFVHALSRTVIAQHDDGSAMPNYATLLNYPIGAEISNLYVPGIRGNGPSTVARIMTGYATDPIENEITEFLPDVARHIHIHVIFVQRVLNQVASDQYSLP